LTIDGFSDPVTYNYNIHTDNNNGRTLAGFSTEAQAKMYECPNCPYPDYEKFRKYYDVFDYANQWVLAAFAGGKTSFANGNADFSGYSFSGRTEAIKKGTAYMNVWMYVIREMEDALDDCKAGCINCNDDPVHAWDEVRTDEGVAALLLGNVLGSYSLLHSCVSCRLLHSTLDLSRKGVRRPMGTFFMHLPTSDALTSRRVVLLATLSRAVPR
jgi:hypothetical protein